MDSASVLFFGFLLGLKHALDSDHVIAVSTIAVEQRSILRSIAVGVWWGVGHMTTLVVCGFLVLALRLRIPGEVGIFLELVVGLVLVGLGVDLLRKARHERLHAHFHSHGERAHVHFHRHATNPGHEHPHDGAIGWRPMLTGVAHGLAGSAAITLLVLGTISDVQLGLLYIGIFGLGTIGGMILVSLALGTVFASAKDRLPWLDHGLRVSLGSLSTAFGAWMVLDLGRQLIR